MHCPKCESRLNTIDTRTTYNSVLRIRVCKNCDTRYRTTERIEESGERVTPLPRGRYKQTD